MLSPTSVSEPAALWRTEVHALVIYRLEYCIYIYMGMAFNTGNYRSFSQNDDWRGP